MAGVTLGLLVVGGVALGVTLSGSSAPAHHRIRTEAPTTSSSSTSSTTSTSLTTPTTSSTPSTSAPVASSFTPIGFTPTPGLLAGKVVGVDPGHNGKNYTDPTFLNKQIFNGVNYEGCDTTGTETDSGYSEAQFNFNVATYLRSDLEADGATVVMTRTSNTGVGPCVTTRAQILNNAGADVAVDIHADGGPTTGRGFAVLEPVADGPNDAIVGPSESLGALVVSHFLTTGIPTSNYDGTNGVDFRNNLAGLNLATEPKILIECGNMKNPIDAALLVTPAFQQSAAAALAQAVIAFLTTNS